MKVVLMYVHIYSIHTLVCGEKFFVLEGSDFVTLDCQPSPCCPIAGVIISVLLYVLRSFRGTQDCIGPHSGGEKKSCLSLLFLGAMDVSFESSFLLEVPLVFAPEQWLFTTSLAPFPAAGLSDACKWGGQSA